MTKRRKLLAQASAVVALGAINLLQPGTAHAARRAAMFSNCGVCVSGVRSPLEYCSDMGTQNAACRDFCPGSLGAIGDCGTNAGNSGCNEGDIGFDCV